MHLGITGRAYLYVNNDGGLISYQARMNYYFADLVFIDNSEINMMHITEGTTFIDEPYPKLDEFGYVDYFNLQFCFPAFPFVFYTQLPNSSSDIGS